MLSGIDVSHHQGKIDWPHVPYNEVDFTFIRVAYGRTLDREFDRNWRGASNVGQIRGPYQYLLPNEDGTVQAMAMLDAIDAAGGLAEGDLSPVLDLEEREVEGVKIAECACIWIDCVMSMTGRQPIIYTGPSFWKSLKLSDHMAEVAAKCPLWIADYRYKPEVPLPWEEWAFWQYTNQGLVRGIGNKVDLNRFDGSFDTLAALRTTMPERSFPKAKIEAKPAKKVLRKIGGF
jgi:lysozyme